MGWATCLLALALPLRTLSLANVNGGAGQRSMAASGRVCPAAGALVPMAFMPTPRITALRSCGNKRSCTALASAVISRDETLAVNATSSPANAAHPSAPSRQSTGSTAVILNMNARSVTPQLASIAHDIFGEENVFVTRTAEDAALAARTIVRGCASVTNNGDDCNGDHTDAGKILQKYSLVVPVGGDGTLSGWINTMVDEILLYHKLEPHAEDDEIARNGTTSPNSTSNDVATVEEAVKQLPLFGYLPMGTGNGLGYVIGCKASKQDIKSSEVAPTARSLLSKMNVFTMMKRRKLERVRRVMHMLKEVGDAARDDTERLRKCSIVEMPVMEVTHPSESDPGTANGKGDLCFFAGAGFDSLMLHDFQQIKAWSKTATRAPAFIRDALSSVTGYCVALVARTLPQTMRYGTHRIHVDVTTSDAETLWVDHRRGDFSELAVPPANQNNGEKVDDGSNEAASRGTRHLVYSGTTGIIAASTTPYYGGGLRLFPYARLIPDRLQLRLGRISPLTGFFNIPQIFEGSYREKGEKSFGCLDFIGREFEVEVKSARYEEYVKRQSEKKADGKRRRRWMPWRGRREKANGQGGEERKAATRGFPFQHSGESMGVKERRMPSVPV